MATYLFTEYLYDAVPRVSKQIQTVDKIPPSSFLLSITLELKQFKRQPITKSLSQCSD